MASRTVIQFSPSKSSANPVATPQRIKRPSPEKGHLKFTTFIISPKRAASASEEGSQYKKIKGMNGKTLAQNAQFDTVLGVTDPVLNQALAQSKRIELSNSLLYDGRAEAPRDGDWTELASLFPTTFKVEVAPPFVVIRVREVPKKPWPLTIGGLPVFFTSHESAEPFDRGRIGQGKKILEEIDLSSAANISDAILHQAASALVDTVGKILDIFWWAGCWTVTVTNGSMLKNLPHRIARAPAFYKCEMDQATLDLSALRNKTPAGVDYDDSSYDSGPNALLRPGVMLSSSIWLEEKDGKKEEQFLSTTSGILVVDRHGKKFITVASHGFGEDGQVWHPTPRNGQLIGRVVDKLSNTEISVVELRPGLSYVNTTFGTREVPESMDFTGISPGVPLLLKIFDTVFMDNPFSGRCEGIVLAMGLKIFDYSSKQQFIRHNWVFFESSNAPVDGSCGSPIWDGEGRVTGFFRFQMKENVTMVLAAVAGDLGEHGYSFYQGQHAFAE